MGGEDEGRLVFRSSAATVEGGGTGKESVLTGGREPGRPELSEGSKRDELVKSVRTLRDTPAVAYVQVHVCSIGEWVGCSQRTQRRNAKQQSPNPEVSRAKRKYSLATPPPVPRHDLDGGSYKEF